MCITLYDVVQRAPGALAAEIDQEIIILDVNSAKYLSLNEVAAAIWRTLETPLSVDDLCQRLQSSFEAQPETITADVLAFLDRLDERGLLLRETK